MNNLIQFSKSARLSTLQFLPSKANPLNCSGFSLTTKWPLLPLSQLVAGFSHYTPLGLLYCEETLVIHSLTNTQNKCSSIQLSRTIAHSKLTILPLSENTRRFFISKLAMVPVCMEQKFVAYSSTCSKYKNYAGKTMHVVKLTTSHRAHRSKSAKHHKLEIQPYILSQESDL